ncbi:MAG: hypothetical protein ABJN69_12910 [Hellea sp.]
MDLLNKYLLGVSPYIDSLIYDLDERELTIVFCKRHYDSKSVGRLIFKDVRSFTEVMFEDAFEENYTDSIMGLHRDFEGFYWLSTEKRELKLRVGVEPVSDFIKPMPS